MLEQRIQQHFFDSADLRYQAAEPLSKPLAEAAQAVFGCLTAGGKLLVGGIGASALLVPIASEMLVGRFERERPGLAAAALPGASGGEAAAALARQVRALGQPGDVLLLVDSTPQAPSAPAVVEAAHGVEMSVVMLAGQGQQPGGWSETDVFVAAPHEREARVVELHLLMLQCLCDAVDVQLMGDQDTP